MRLRSIRLHPFGRFTDESWDLAQPLVVVHGPNELGKTTLRQAIVHALFTPTKLSKRDLAKTVGPWLPLPAGDHAAAALTFEHGGATWTLEKRWGAGASSRLSDGTIALADADAVQTRLSEMLEHGEATFRHVLFTGQAELEGTLEAIEAQAGQLRDIRDLLSAAGNATADVDEQRLRQRLVAKIEKAFSRWDDERARPERQNGQDKGISDPWKRDVGDILAAWYAWQRLEAERDELLRIEQELDRANGEVATIEKTIASCDVFVKRFAGLRDDLGERGLLDERVPRLANDVAALAAAFSGWPKAEAAIAEWQRQKPASESQRDSLAVERAAAERRKAGAAIAASFQKIQETKRACEEAEAELAKQIHPGNERLDEIDRLEKAIMAAENKLASRKLSWRIEAAAPGAVTVERGLALPETMTVGPEAAAGMAEARVRVVAGGVTLTVESGGDDVAALFESLQCNRDGLATAMKACGAETPAAVRLMAERYRAAAAVAMSKKDVYNGLLLGKPFEYWAEEIKAIESLPNTRDLHVIETEIEAIRKRLADGDAEARKHQESIDGWKKSYGDPEALGERLLQAKADLKEANERLAALPGVPEGFGSTKAFLAELDAMQLQQVEAQKQLTVKKEDAIRLTARLADRRSEDLAEQAEAARRAFERARAEGRAYLRIREELDRISAGAGGDPLSGFGDRVADIFSRITGGAATLQFDGQLPASVVRCGVALPPERLSHGGGGALALAVRLAMAEAYFGEEGGFIMLDDPLVHFDPERMGQAADILRTFAERSQVIFFTCHDHHAERIRNAP